MNAESDLPQDSAPVENGGVDEKPAETDAVTVEGEQVAAVAEVLPEDIPVGQRLRTAREAKGMSTLDVAARLKLSPHQVDALESGDWTRLQCNTISRGFVRNYARLVGLDGAVLMLALDRVAAPLAKELVVPSNINVKVPNEYGVERRDYLRVAGGFLVLTIAILAYFFLPTDFVQTTYSSLKERVSSKSAEPPVKSAEPERRGIESEASPVLAPPAAAADSVTSPSAPGVSAPAALSSPAPAPVSEAPAAANASGAVLKFSFSKPSWVEIKDRSGQIIFSQLSPAGAQREISGQPPLALVIGNSANVTLQYKGKNIDLSSRRSKDDVARLTIE